jgi:hypothetical protein
LIRKSKKWHRDIIDYHIVIDFSNSINYHHLNHFIKTLDTKNKHISIRIHRSLEVSSKQLTRFFDVQKNLSFSLENNIVKTYINVNDHKSVSTEPLSFPPPVTAFEFKNNSLNWENNYSMSSYVLNNSLFNSLAKLTSLKSHPMLFFSVSPHSESEHHLDSNYVFPLLSPLSTNYTHPPTVDSPGLDHEFEELLLHFVYRSSSTPSSPTSSNPFTDSHTALKRFTEFHKQPIHVFSSLSSFYYSFKQPFSKSH